MFTRMLIWGAIVCSPSLASAQFRFSEPSSDPRQNTREDRLFRAYLQARLDALGHEIVQPDSTAFEITTAVLKLRAGGYDVTIVVSDYNCSLAPMIRCRRAPPIIWRMFHNYDDLGEVARIAAEGLHTELDEWIRRLTGRG